MAKKPTSKKTPALKVRPFVCQLGSARVASQIHDRDTDKQARSVAVRHLRSLIPDQERYNQEGLPALHDAINQCETASFPNWPDTRVVHVEWPGMPVPIHVEFWHDAKRRAR